MKLNINEVEHRSRDAMAELIGLFRHPTPAQRGNLSLPEEEKKEWLRLFDNAVGIPPRTLRPGLQAILALVGHPHSVEKLEAMGAVKVTGNRVAFQWLGGPRSEPALPHPDGWTLVFCHPTAAATRLVEKTFRTVDRGPSAILASFPILEDTHEELAVLLHNASTSRNDLALLGLWHKAGAIGRQLDFVDRLTHRLRERLVATLEDILRRSKVELSVDTDLAHEGFASNGRVQRHLRLPDGRYGQCAQADVVLGFSPEEMETSYHEDVVRSFCAGGRVADVANVLAECPPGRVLHAAEHFIASYRDDVIPSLCHHPDWVILGTRILNGLGVRLSRSGPADVSLDLSEEKLRLQKMALRLLIAEVRVPPAEALAASIRVEQLAGIPQTYSRPEPRLVFEDLVPMWVARLANEKEPERCAKTLLEYLDRDDPPTDADLVVAFHLATLIGNEDSDAGRFAAATAARAYTTRIGPERPVWTRVSSNPERLARAAAESIRLIRPEEPWQNLLRPFDPTRLCQIAKADEASERTTLSSSDPVPWMDHMRLFSGHGDFLVHLAAHTSPDAGGEALRAFAELYLADRLSLLRLPAFGHSGRRGFNANAIGQADKTLVTLGGLLERSDFGRQFARSMVRTLPDPFVLGSVAAGLSDETLRSHLLGHVKDLAPERIAGGLSVGESLDLAAMLLRAGCSAEAVTMAEEAIRIAGSVANNQGAQFVALARTILVGALADQERWSDVLTVQVENHYPEEQIHVLNFHAVAMLETGEFADAERVLDGILKRSPRNPMALANKTYALLRQNKWDETLRAADNARILLGDTVPPVVIANEKAALNAREGKSADLEGGILENPPVPPPQVSLPLNTQMVFNFHGPVVLGNSSAITLSLSQSAYTERLDAIEAHLKANTEALEALGDGVSEGIWQLLRNVRKIEIEGKSFAAVQAAVKETVDEIAASDFGRTLGEESTAKLARMAQSFFLSIAANLATPEIAELLSLAG